MRPLTLGLLLLSITSPSFGQTAETASDTVPELQPELQRIADASAKRLPAEMRQKFTKGVDDVLATGILEEAAKVGDSVPKVELIDLKGEKVSSESLWRDRPAVITFYRGGWCPYCNAQLRVLQKSLDALQGAGANVVAITPELTEHARKTTADNNLAFDVLTDEGNTFARELGIAFRLPDVILPIYRDKLGLASRNGDDRYELPLAATYVVSTDGVIRYAFLDADYKKRAEPKAILKAVEKINREI